MPSVDRLSELTEPLRCRILSFLPTKDSVSTSILSREWRYLWTKVPTLDLRDCDEDHPLISAGGPRFSEVIHRFLQWNRVPIDTIRIRFMNRDIEDTEDITQYGAETLIFTAIDREVKTLDLSLSLSLNLEIFMPRSLFISKTLVDLTLYEVDLGTPWPRHVSFPSLKKLFLSMVLYRRDETLQQLISGCPVLENLVIEGIFLGDLVRCIISSPTIKWLEVDFVLWETPALGYSSSDYRLEIDAPALGYLRINDSLSEHISAGLLNSLIEADVTIQTEGKIQDEAVYSGHVFAFVEKLCHVKYLKLSIDYAPLCMHFVDLAFSASTIKFGNLTELELSADFRFITRFVGNADNLQVLTINQVGKHLSCWWNEPQEMPTCLSSHLRIITIGRFGCAEHVFGMIKYLLKNARILNTVNINFYSSISMEKKSYAIQRILEYERGSVVCEFAFN